MAGKSCTSCGSEELEPGFVMDSGEGSSGYSRWVRGQLETGMLGGAKIWGKDRIEIQALRCVDCGHLELFAMDLYS